jgi:hypothetical protein
MLCRLLKNAAVGIVTAVKANATEARERKERQLDKDAQLKRVNHAGNVDGD